MNPLGMVEALMGALNHSADLLVQQSNGNEEHIKNGKALLQFSETLRKALHNTFRYGQGTRDMAGPDGLTTEKFIDKVAWRLGRYLAAQSDEVSPADIVVPARSFRRNCESLFYLRTLSNSLNIVYVSQTTWTSLRCSCSSTTTTRTATASSR